MKMDDWVYYKKFIFGRNMKMQKILIILNYYYPYISGVSEYARVVAEELVKKGNDVTVLTSNHDKLQEKEIINGVKVIRAPILGKISKGTISIKFVTWAKKYAKEADIVNMHLPMLESGLISLLVDKKKLVSMYQCDVNLPPSILNKLIVKVMDWSHKIALSRSRYITVTSRDYGEHSRIAYRFTNKMMEASAPSKDYSLMGERRENETPVIGFCGRIVEEKGIDILLQAFSILQKKGYNYKLLIGGDYKKVAGGSIYGDLLDIIQKENLKNVQFIGMIPEEKMGEFYKSLDVFVLPSTNSLEAYGMVQVEAMLCGTPVVSSDLYGVRTIPQKTGMGLVTKKKDPEDLAKGIREVLEHKDRYIKTKEEILSVVGTKKCLDVFEECFRRCI